MKDPLEEAGVDVDRGVATKVLLLVIAALVAVFVVEPSSRTPLLIVVGVILLVMFHEAGHYFTAKRSGMKVTEFFLGFGPRLWSFRRGETEYGVKAIPAGGYVRIVGMSNLEEIDPADESRTFRSGRTRNRLIVILAGVTVNAVLAFLLFFVAVAGEGRVATGDASTTVSRVEAGTAARAAGFRPGDRIVAIDGDPVRGWTALRRGILSHGGESTTFTVVRKGTTVDLTATPELQDGRGFLGIAPSVAYRSVGALEAVPETFRVMGTTVTGTFEGIGRVFSPSGLSSIADNFTSHAPKEGSRADLERPRSLVGIVDQGSAIVGDDVWTLLRLLGVLSMLFAVFNLLPLLPFDGGHAVVVVYEAIASKIRGRTVRVDFRKLTPVMATTILILALVAVPTMLLDLRDVAGR